MTRFIPSPPGWMTAVLYAAAAYHLIWGACAVVFPRLPFSLLGVAPPNYPALVQAVGMLIGVFGVGFLVAARDPARYWPVVLMGLMEKVLGPIGLVWSTSGDVPWIGWLGILTDDVAWWLPFTGILLYAAKVQDEEKGGIGSFREELERARTSRGESVWDLSFRQPLLVVFVRHAGCTFCREAVHDVGRHADAIQAAGVKPIIVHMGSIEDGRQLLRWSGRDDLDTVSDPERRLFRVFELRLGGLWQLAGPYVIWRALFGGTLFRYGFGKMIGHGMQLAGAFLVDRGVVIRSYRCRTTADKVDFAGLACARPAT